MNSTILRCAFDREKQVDTRRKDARLLNHNPTLARNRSSPAASKSRIKITIESTVVLDATTFWAG